MVGCAHCRTRILTDKVQMMSRLSLPVLLLTALSGCAHAPASPRAADASLRPAAPSEIVPWADYHVHLLGPYALPVNPPLPEVQVPPGVRQLLQARARLFGPDRSSQPIDDVYTTDAAVLDDFIDTRWMVGEADIARFLTIFSRHAVRLVPSSVRIGEDAGFVAGTVVVDSTGAHGLNFVLGIARGRDGRWRIASEAMTRKDPPRYTQPITADRLIADLDRAGIRRALVLSEAFWIGGPEGARIERLAPAPDQPTAVRLENDWTAQQVARYPDRLVMACGINPLDAWAIAELERCSTIPQVRAMKLNIGEGGDDIDLHDAAQVRELRRFFQAANARRMPIVVHLGSRGGFGRAEVRIFLREIMSAAPDIPVQIAHLSSGFQHRDALAEFADARAANDPSARNLYFDLSVGSFKDLDPELGQFIARSIRAIGLEHVLYASDEQPGDHHAPTAVHWAEMLANLPLTRDEFRAIADNVAPYMR